MYRRVFSLALPAAFSFLLALLAVPMARRLARQYGVMAVPGPDSRHEQPIGLLGGAAIVTAFLGALALTHNVPYWIFVSSCMLAEVGVLNDCVALRPGQKLATQAVAILGLVLLGLLAIFRNLWVNSAIVVAWLVGTTIAFNLVDGLDGLPSDIGVVTALAVAATAALHHDLIIGGQALALGGALCGFLVYNFYPASIFITDGGAFAGGVLGRQGTSWRLPSFS